MVTRSKPQKSRRLEITVIKRENGWHTAQAMGVTTYAYREKQAKKELRNYFRRLNRNGITPEEHLRAMRAYSMMLRAEAEDCAEEGVPLEVADPIDALLDV
jgi:hypothetical protein